MNDAFRGAVIVVALVALYLAARLAWAFLRHWKTDRRRHVTTHVFWLVIALLTTVVLVVTGLVEETGTDAPLSWHEWARLVEVVAVAAGLRPLWAHHRAIATRREVSP